jgi:hypothetical protein
MNHSSTNRLIAPQCAYELRFQSLFNAGRGYAFPCDRQGHVDLETLSERLRANYLRARRMIGLELAIPAVRQLG